MTRLRISSGLLLLVAFIASSSSAPAPAPADDSRPEIIEIIAPAEAAQETLETLNLGEPNAEQSERNKRTIGILRQLFPNLSMIIDQKVQQIVSFIFRTVGRQILSGAIGGGGGAAGGASGGSGGKVSVSLPTYSPDDDDDEDEDEDSDEASSSSSTTTTTARSDSDSEVQASNVLATSEQSSFATEASSADTTTTTATESSSSPPSSSASSSSSATLSSDSISPDSSTETTTENVPSTVPATAAVNADENALSEAESQQSEVRVQFTGDGDSSKSEDSKDESSDQESAASNNGALDDLSIDDADSSDENRDKRFLSFGGGDSHGSASSGSGGGSGNFLFDIIRRPAENAARAAGQVFRILTGTDSIGLGITATHTAVRDLPDTYTNTLNNASRLLVAGSGNSEHSDEAHSAAADGDVAKGDGYTEGIPGPVTRLFIIANRGIANLIQDLILRIAQTSERLVNFKARLITSII